MNTTSFLGRLGLCCALASPAWANNTPSWSRASDLMAVSLPALATGLALKLGDTTGARQLALSLGSSLAAAELLKGSVHATRPDGSDNKSFPSGHTAVAFSAATFIDHRYGAQYVVFTPLLYGVAALTGVARVEARKHRWSDVLAGGTIGWGASRLWTEPVAGGHLSVLPARGGLAVAWAGRF